MAVKSVVVFTDVGVKDIDDELLLQYLIENKKEMEISVVFMGSDGVSPEEALKSWSKYKGHILSKYSVEEQKELCKKISYHTIENFKKVKCSFDFALQIAPMDGYGGENIEIKEKYIFAGDYITPEGARPSFNRQGADEILDRFYNEGKLVDIPSVHMAKMRFNQELVSKFTGPFLDSIVFTAFMLAFGRMDPKHPANKFAEGLVNPDVGRGANYNSVMKMGFELQGISTTEFCRMQGVLGDDKLIDIKSCESAATNYCDTLELNGVTLKDRDGTIKCLTDMNIYLQSITVSSALPLKKGQTAVIHRSEIVNIFESGSVFTSDFDINSIPSEIQPAWDFFKQNADKLFESFNPVYDLFAGYVLIGEMNGEKRVIHTPEVFLKNVCEEF